MSCHISPTHGGRLRAVAGLARPRRVAPRSSVALQPHGGRCEQARSAPREPSLRTRHDRTYLERQSTCAQGCGRRTGLSISILLQGLLLSHDVLQKDLERQSRDRTGMIIVARVKLLVTVP